MNSKKVWSFLLLIAMSYSFVHDYAFNIFHDEHHSVQEYVSELTTLTSSEIGDIHDVHFEYHVKYIFQSEFVSSLAKDGKETFFPHNKIFLSWKYFNFFKPPIV